MDDPRRAEFAACELMIEMGFTDAMVTIQSRDGGYDAISTSAIAEVKWQAARTPPKDVRALNGVKGDRQALFFNRSGYSANAIEFATVTTSHCSSS